MSVHPAFVQTAQSTFSVLTVSVYIYEYFQGDLQEHILKHLAVTLQGSITLPQSKL